MALTLKERILNWKNSGNNIDTLSEAETHISKAWELIDDLCERIELATKTGN